MLGAAVVVRADSLETWGWNMYGQLGNGTATSSNVPVQIQSLGSRVTTVAAAGTHSLAIVNGAIWAWGENYFGEVGNGTITTTSPYGITSPVPVANLTSGVTAISGGYLHSLAIMNGAVYAWGVNGAGELGTGTTSNATTPVTIPGLSSGVTAIAAGGANSMAIQNSALFAWGANNEGQISNAVLGSSTTTPLQMPGFGSGVTAIAEGQDAFSLAVQNGHVYAWGNDDYDQLGSGTPQGYSQAPLLVTGLPAGVSAIAAGADHALALVNGTVYDWGYGGNGQLGGGSSVTRGLPAQVDPVDLSNIVAIAAGTESSYALASDGSLWEWGSNYDGELGLGTATLDYFTPQHLLPPAGYRFTSVQAGRDSPSAGTHVLVTLGVVPEPVMSLGLIGWIGIRVSSRRSRSADKCDLKIGRLEKGDVANRIRERLNGTNQPSRYLH